MVLGEIERAALHILHVGEHELASEESLSQMRRETWVVSPSTPALERQRRKFCKPQGR